MERFLKYLVRRPTDFLKCYYLLVSDGSGSIKNNITVMFAKS